MLHLCFVYVLFVFRLYFFYVCQNPKILFSQNKILDFCLTQVLRKQNVCQTQVKHRANIVSHNSAHLQRRWKNVRDSWDTWLPEWFVDSFVFCWWVVLCFIVDSLAFCLWWVSDVFMIHLCLLLCCVYVVLCWFFTSLVYVRLLASDRWRSPLGLPKCYDTKKICVCFVTYFWGRVCTMHSLQFASHVTFIHVPLHLSVAQDLLG